MSHEAPTGSSIELAAVLCGEPTWSAREAAIVLRRSFSWLDQGLRGGQFTRPDGTAIQPLRTPGGYRYFTVPLLRDVATCCYRHRWYSLADLKAVVRDLIVASNHDEYVADG